MADPIVIAESGGNIVVISAAPDIHIVTIGEVGPKGPAGAGSGNLSDTLPLMNGAAAAGVADDASRGDHVHPSDASRAPASHVGAGGAAHANAVAAGAAGFMTGADKTKLDGLASVASSGAYGDLSGRPTLGTLAALSYPSGTTLFLRADGTWQVPPGGGGGGVWGSISGTLSAQTDLNAALGLKAATSAISTVGFSGLYADLLSKPTLGTLAALSYPSGTTTFLRADGTWAAPTAAAAWGSITGTITSQTDLTTALVLKANTSSLATVATTGAYADLSGKPTLGTVAALNTTGSTTTFLRGDGTFTTPGGSGDVVGPASAVTANIATFNGTTGKLIQDGGTTIAALATSISGKEAAITGTTAADFWSGAKTFLSFASTVWATVLTGLSTATSTAVVATDSILVAIGKLQAQITLRATLAAPTFTGIPAAPTAAALTNTTQLATTAFVTTADNLKANLASPTLTGTPLAPTATAGTNTTQIATTAFVAAAIIPKQDRSPAIQSVTSSATVTPTFSNDMVKVTAQAAALALANPTGTPIDGLGIVIRVKDNGTARAITYDTQYRAIGVTLPATTVVSKTLYLAMAYNSDDTTWDVIAVGQQA
jgi:hypothetical protein